MKIARPLILSFLLCLPAVSHAQDATALAELDASVLESLRALGSDLKKPHQVDFYLSFDSEAAAKAASAQAVKDGYAEIELAPSLDGEQWQLQVQRTMVPEQTAINGVSRAFGALAQQHKGEYDGWSAVPAE